MEIIFETSSPTLPPVKLYQWTQTTGLETVIQRMILLFPDWSLNLQSAIFLKNSIFAIYILYRSFFVTAGMASFMKSYLCIFCLLLLIFFLLSYIKFA